MHEPADLADASRHLKSIWHALADAAKSSDAALRTPMLATIGLDGSPRGRTIVLRSVDPKARELRFFADARSPKVEEVSRDPRASLTFWDPAIQVQLRVTGECVRLYDETAIRAAWKNVPASNRKNYQTALPPGSASPAPGTPGEGGGEGFDNFALLVFVANEFDWLWLDRAGHMRCRFDLSMPEASREWLVP